MFPEFIRICCLKLDLKCDDSRSVFDSPCGLAATPELPEWKEKFQAINSEFSFVNSGLGWLGEFTEFRSGCKEKTRSWWVNTAPQTSPTSYADKM